MPRPPAPAVPRRLLTLLAAVIAVAALLLPLAASPVAAADDGIALTSKTTYTLQPEEGRVHVAIGLTARNTKPDLVEQTPIGTRTTRYFFESASIAVQPEATNVRARIGRTQLNTVVTPGDGFAVLRVDFADDLFFGDSVDVLVQFDLPGGAPRSASNIRVGSAFATFYAWAFGDGGDLRIQVPADYQVEATGSPTNESVADGVTTIAAAGIADVTDWYAIVVADRRDALTRDRLDLPGGEHLVIRAWPEDAEWQTRVREILTESLPVLVERIGLDWPVPGDIEVAEVHTPLLEGYAGVFFENEDRIEISEDLDELTIVHEASHAWFNGELFGGRWIDEGLANEYASRALRAVGSDAGGSGASGGSGAGLDPGPVTPTSPGAVRLNEWQHPGRIADAETQAREAFGYDASWRVIRELVDEVGENGMRDVLGAANRRETAYVGAGAPETVSGTADWRRFLDLLEERAGSAGAEALFRRWVVTPDEATLLDTRRATRSAYAALVADGTGWQPGWVVREPLGRWDFAAAAEEIGAAREVLAFRDRIADAAAVLGVVPPSTLRDAYETETTDVAAVRGVAARELAAVTGLVATERRASIGRGSLTEIGLLGEDVDGSLARAVAAFSAGDLDAASAGAAAVDGLLAGAENAGRTRLGVGGLAVVGVAAAGGAVFALRRRRHAAAQEAGGPYATLGDPRPVDAPAAPDGPAAEEPAEQPAEQPPAEPERGDGT